MGILAAAASAVLVRESRFRERGFSAGIGFGVAFFLGIASFGLVLTLFLQLGLGVHTAARRADIPAVLGGCADLLRRCGEAGAAFRPRGHHGRALIIAAAMAGLIASVHHYGAAVTTWELVPGLVGAGLGLGAVIAPLADIVLARVPRQDAGSASGVFNTALQIGNSVGIALIGVIFFGLLGSQSGPAAATVAPQLRAGLAAAGVPAQHLDRVQSQFGICLHDRLIAADPTVTPPSCRPGPADRALPAAATRVLAGTGAAAVRDDFAASVQRTLWFQVGVFGLAFLLMLALPRSAGRSTPENRSQNAPSQLVAVIDGH